MFSHDTELSLQVVVEFVNTAPECGGGEGLPHASAVQAFVEQHHVSGVDPREYDRLEPLYAVRGRLHALFGASDPAQIASWRQRPRGEIADASTAERPRRPRLASPLLLPRGRPRRAPCG